MEVKKNENLCIDFTGTEKLFEKKEVEGCCYMTVNELINTLCEIENQNVEVLRLEFNENSSEIVVVVAKDENWEEEYKIKVK